MNRLYANQRVGPDPAARRGSLFSVFLETVSYRSSMTMPGI